ncbi:MAG: hypothetical protein IJW71_00590 [Clostridia bacterium]|nr:hypothetical protein [Clostridia bacterium]
MKQYDPKKPWDTALARLLLTAVFCLLLCAACVSSATFAWFSDGVNGISGQMKTSGECRISALIRKNDTEFITVTIAENERILQCEGTYTVTLTLPRGSASGYLVIRAGDREYYSEILQSNDTNDQTICFTLNVSTVQPLTFSVRWGTHSDSCHIKNEGKISIE